MSYKSVFLLFATLFALILVAQAKKEVAPLAKRQACDFGNPCKEDCKAKCKGENIGRDLRDVCYQGACYCGFTP
ncbi:hypothetical protein BC940DRAFT_290987 [Gongronella butleri]|nr:hypothetical protein BC940DRAFT_290987 [Gongronella butleri]